MDVNGFLFKNKRLLCGISLCAFIISILISYINYGTEPWETIGGFICGFSFGLFILFISIKKIK